MAEATGLRNNALPYPIYGAPFSIVFPMLDADGDLVTGATTPDAERSLNGDTFADCTNESTEIATNSGVYYLILTAAEMTADVVAVIAKSATAGMKTTVSTLYPRKLVTIRSGTSDSGGASTSTIVLDSGASAVDDYYNGMVCIATIDSVVEARVISDYTGSSKTATVVPNWNTAPDNDDTFVIKLPEGAQHGDTVFGDKIYSDTTIIYSDTTHIDSDVTLFVSEGDVSDVLSRLVVTNSQLLIVKSDTSDIRSHLVVIHSETTATQAEVTQVHSETTDIQSETEVIQSLAVAIEDFASDIYSDTVIITSDLAEGDTSDILSRLTVTNSQLLIVKSDTSDIKSSQVIVKSDLVDIYSDTTAIEASGGLSAAQASQLSQIHSDQASQFVVLEQNTSDTESALVKVYSDTTKIESDTAVIEAVTSDIQSDTNKLVSDASEVDTSDIQSLLTKVYSDTTIIVPGVSDIHSLATKIYSDTTVIASDTTLITGSQFAVLEQNTSDTESALVKIYSDTTVVESDTTAIEAAGGSLSAAQDSWLSQIHSDTLATVIPGISDNHSHLVLVRSDTTHIESDAAAIELIASDIQSDTNKLVSDASEVDTSDIQSLLTKVYSDTTIVVPGVSDIHSLATKIYSDTTAIESGGGALTAAQASQLSQVHSDQASQFVVLEQNTSDTESALVKVYSDTTVIESQALVIKSDTSDIKSSLVKVYSDTTKIESDAAAIEVGVSDTESALVKVYSDTTHIDSDTTLISGSQFTVLEDFASDIYSDTTAGSSGIAASTESQIAEIHSDVLDGSVQVDVRKVKGITVKGSGTKQDPWQPA